MEEVGYPDKRVEYIDSCNEKFVYKRDGELLKEELKEILQYMDAWNGTLEGLIKESWRRTLRYSVGIEYNNRSQGNASFSEHELFQIWREVSNICEHHALYDEEKAEYYCPVCGEL